MALGLTIGRENGTAYASASRRTRTKVALSLSLLSSPLPSSLSDSDLLCFLRSIDELSAGFQSLMRHKRVTGKLHASLLLRLAAITLDLPALVFLLQTAGLPPDVSTAPARQTALFSVCQVRIRIIDYQRREYTGGSRCQPGLSLVCLFVCLLRSRTHQHSYALLNFSIHLP